MKIIFLKDVPRIGRKYEIKEVADGYGRHLVAQKVAEIATQETLSRIEQKKIAQVDQKKETEKVLNKALAVLHGAEIMLRGKANEKGHLFASIHKEEVRAEIKRVYHIDLGPEHLVLEKPFKELGTFEVPVVIGAGRAILKVVVERQ